MYFVLDREKEQEDYQRAVLLEQAHQMELRHMSGINEMHGRAGVDLSKDMDESLERLVKIEFDYAAIIAKHPRWGKTALKH